MSHAFSNYAGIQLGSMWLQNTRLYEGKNLFTMV